MTKSRAARRSGRGTAAAPPSILVASYLIINAFDSCHAAPRPVQTANAVKRNDAGALKFDDIDEFLPRYPAAAGKSAVAANSNDESYRHQTLTMDPNLRDAATPTLKIARRTFPVTTGSGKAILVPSAFASNIASSWDPGKRSIWFQRKAVIICSIFLAIFIVLIIGAAVFLRDKRILEAEGDIDVSDEAALKKMKEEREMRKGGRGEKKRKRRRTKEAGAEGTAGGDTTSGKDVKGISTGIRWVKVSTRKLTKRKADSASRKSRSLQSDVDDDRSSGFLPRVSTSSRSRDDGSNDRSQTSQGPELVTAPEDAASVESGDSPRGGQEITRNDRTVISIADVAAADEAVRQQQSNLDDDDNVDALPPAYIPSHRRSTSQSPEQIHPSADRQLGAGVVVPLQQLNDEKSQAVFEDAAPGCDTQATSSTQPFTTFNANSDLRTQTNITASIGQDNYSAHIATDDKDVLGRLRNAASYPSAPPLQQVAAPSYDSSPSSPDAPTALLQTNTLSGVLASAPSDLEVAAEELAILESDQGRYSKGKGTRMGSTLLPAPPRPLSSATYSHFDMPYSSNLSPSRTGAQPAKSTSAGKEKAREAEEENRKALALVESRPEDLNHLPQYEGQDRIKPSAPSAPQEEEESNDRHDNTLPSAPSAPPED
ncbi:hypothetical protein CBS101457_005183 [Exobasidium rhododendri]|nr:hypothetical protein CBS101457_005183 [Exobasidium rhododendri]